MSNFAQWHENISMDPERRVWLECLRFCKEIIIEHGSEAICHVDRELDEVLREGEK